MADILSISFKEITGIEGGVLRKVTAFDQLIRKKSIYYNEYVRFYSR